MFCPKCGNQLPDDSKFCGICGEKITYVAPEIQPVPKAAPASALPSVAPGGIRKTGSAPSGKKIAGKLAIGVAVVAVVAVVAAVLIKVLPFGSGRDNAYVYLSDGKYELITDLDKNQDIEIASSKNDDITDHMVAFSPDGKYIYYYTKYDSDSQTGSLCRAEYGKLKKDSSKNDKYIDIIATNVELGFRFFDDGSVAYQNGAETLFCFDGKETTQIAKNVNSYFIHGSDGSDRIVYTTGNYSDGYTLYGVSRSDVDNKIKFASNVAYVESVTDFDNILYAKEDGDSTTSLYVVGFDKETEKLGEKVDTVDTVDEKTYFTAENGATLNLYDFVEDPFAGSDAGVTEPVDEDFIIPKYSYDMVHGTDLSESDFDELYTSCVKLLYWYGESTWWCYSMEDAVNKNWGDNTEQIHAATQSFIDKFASAANEDGYILVTDEVKAALKEIQKCGGDPEKEWQWMWLCYNKRPSGQTVDYDAYDAAWDRWDEAKNRIEMRETLKSKENEYPVKTLYCFDKGTLTVVAENVLDTRSYFGEAFVYNTTDLIPKTVPIEDISSAEDVLDLFDVYSGSEDHIILSDGTSCQMSASAAQAYAEAWDDGYAYLVFTDKEVYLDCYGENDDSLSVATIDGGVVGDFTLIADDGDVMDIDGSTMYYMRGFYQSNDMTYCDLYSYTKGISTRLARDVLYMGITIYDDGWVLAETDYKNDSGCELTMIDPKGEATRIGDDITQYIRVDKSTLLYISDGDLYFYNGKEKKKVQNNVDWIWSKNEMAII